MFIPYRPARTMSKSVSRRTFLKIALNGITLPSSVLLGMGVVTARGAHSEILNPSKTPDHRISEMPAVPGKSASCGPDWNGCVSPIILLANDRHSQLNRTQIARVETVTSLGALQAFIKSSAGKHESFSTCGDRHAGGGQQFARMKPLLDTTKMNRVLSFDKKRGILEVESGIKWPELLLHLNKANRHSHKPWGIAQKQTGTDLLTLGGTLSANAHGQGLTMKPFVGDIESFVIVNSKGEILTCSRSENRELFSLAIGGYGLFGTVYSIKLRLRPRQKVQRLVEMMNIDQVIPTVENCIASGFPYGDFQFDIDERSDGYLKYGIFSKYKPVDIETPLREDQRPLSLEEWLAFVQHAHVNKKETFEKFAEFYKSSSGFVNWSDVWQTSTYLNNYHAQIDKALNYPNKTTEVLTEIYVPRKSLVRFIEEAREYFLKNNVNLIYSTIRFIAKDDETFLPWAKDDYACVIFNLHTVHTPTGIEHSASAFRHLIDLAIKYGGSYYLTYHKFATQEQVQACYPQFQDFLRLKLRYDPDEQFCSNWYWHYRDLFA